MSELQELFKSLPLIPLLENEEMWSSRVIDEHQTTDLSKNDNEPSSRNF